MNTQRKHCIIGSSASRNNRLVLVGANNPEILRLISDIYAAESETYEILGWVDNNEQKIGQDVFGYPVLGSPDILSQEHFKDAAVVNCVTTSGKVRKQVCEQLSALDVVPKTLVHPSIDTNQVLIGSGVLVHRGVILEAGVCIGDGSSIASGVTVCHETLVGRYCLLASGSVVAGQVKIQDEVTLWTGAIITPRLTLRHGAIIGAGATVFSDVDEHTTVAGNPARKVLGNRR